MVDPGRHRVYTIEEYVGLEEYANVKHEYLDGQIYAMAGGTPEHSAMAVRVSTALATQLRGRPCNVYGSDARVRVLATGLDTYPDAAVVCGQVNRDSQDANAIVNPVVLVEVLSPSTQGYDRGAKPEHYKQIPTLRDVLLLAHEQPLVEHWSREPGGAWTRREVRAGGTVVLPSIDCTLPVDDVYRDPLAG